MERFWYSYVIPDGDPRLSSSYHLLKINNGTLRCSTGTRLCAINAPEGGLAPFSPLSQNLQDYVAAALANGVPQPELPIGARLFVYLKN